MPSAYVKSFFNFQFTSLFSQIARFFIDLAKK